MTWQCPALFFVGPNSTTEITLWWPSYQDQGPQWAMAHPLPGEPDVPLVTERVGKQLVCELGEIIENGPPVFQCAGTGSEYQYVVWITNDGSSGCRFFLQGGGV